MHLTFDTSAGKPHGERRHPARESWLGPGGGRQIVVNADDFGASSTINAAVIQAHREGVLTATSLMVAGAAADEAIALARETPTLAVGLHLVVVDGPAVLSPAEIPHLVDGHGCFPADPVRLGVRYAFDAETRAELAREMAAQFSRFADSGLPLAHVDGHLHMHMHPTVLDILLPLAAQHGARGMRLPRDELCLGLRWDRRHAGLKLVWALAFSLLSRRVVARLGTYGLVVTRRVYGLMQTGHMDEAYVLTVLARLSVSTAELYFHPDTRPGSDGLGPNRGDLDTLLSPAVAHAIRSRGLRLAAYSNLVVNEGT